jgi:pimeloyl-ACP methyl ester carboxylesterase
MTGFVPFTIAVPQDVLDDLARRLDATRWPGQAAGAPWLYGADLGYVMKLAAHWRHNYDWRKWERRLNATPNHRARIGGFDLHFMVERGSGSNPLPLLLLHGWPRSVAEFLDVIEPLAHPERHGGSAEDGFTVVIPSLPGSGFSSPPDRPVTPERIAQLFATLMRDVLGFDHYAAQGGDWGAMITSWMALHEAPGLKAVHLNGPGLAGGHQRPEPADQPLTAEEVDWLVHDAERRHGHFAYQQLQGTEPRTLAYGLTDSPVALAAWMVQRFHAWTVRSSTGATPFDMDHLLTNIMLYWLSGINAPNWLYVSLVEGTARKLPPGRRVELHTAFTLCPDDNTIPAPQAWLERAFANIVRRNDAQRGGHFLALEQPELFVTELRAPFADFRITELLDRG